MKLILKKSITIWILFFALLASCQSQVQTSIKPNPTLKYQTIEGWGSSLCWWAHMAGQWENENKIDEIIDLITSPDQLNMNIFRYNIGGGDDPAHYSTPDKPGHMAHGKGIRAEIQGFKTSENQPYDWSADAGQRKIMLKIKEKRPDAIFEAFSNSAPYWMTYSGCSAGNDPSTADNLKPEYYEAFCDYLLDVCQFYKDSFKIEFKTLEPFNEPLTNYWGNKGGQEGCHFSVQSQIDLLRILYPKLKATELTTVLSASDETDIAGFIRTMEAYLQTEDIPKILGQVNTHSYSGNNTERKKAQKLAEQIGVTFWQSESGPIDIPGRGITSNLGLAQRMFNDLKYLRTPAWIDWQVLEVNSDAWGLLNSHKMDENFIIMKNFYVRMQVTRFIKQGYTIIESGNDKLLCALSPDEKELVAVLLNELKTSESVRIDLSDFKNIGDIKFFRTSLDENCTSVSDAYALKRKILEYNAPNQSISTFVIPLK
ncbi:glycoside hydrolase [Carboxylicivirga caseinilyticus]|uniref:glycoside hydrolase n=1 Tax=Carboxylicivirga caseinilyticus TaxID=3417572 RepID=UPI003D34B959|nr:hypothetical protein [Marinilabiliaceae bacterium A049]